MLRIATVNVNGVRAAFRKGMSEWLAESNLDIVTLQEVRAPDDIARELLADTGYHVAQIETDLTLANGTELTVVSVYVHSGEVGTPKQDDKYRFLEQMTVRLNELTATRPLALVTGDLNVAHTELDIKNWKGNLKKAGFLPEERAYFDSFFGEMAWVDVHRTLAGPVPGPYTWWSMRGQAFDNDAGWRIDYQMATPKLASQARSAVVDRADSYDTRWSDHAPLIVEYDI